MRYDRKEYEIKIANSPLFSLNKEKQYNDYKKEAFKMVEHIYCYLCSGNNEKYVDLGCEIVEFANRCINSYDISKGMFLHYINAAWKMNTKKYGKKVLMMRNTEDYTFQKLTNEM